MLNLHKYKNASVRKVLSQIVAISINNLLLISYGMANSFSTILIPSLSGYDPKETIHMDQELISWIGSINLIFVPVGCLLSGTITNALGRKKTMILVNLPILTTWILLYFSTKPWHIFLAISTAGLYGGLLEPPVQAYGAEIAQPHLRGRFGAVSVMCMLFGSLIQFLLGTFLTWRKSALVNCSVPIVSIFLLLFLPESPIWLITKGRYDEAKKSMAWLRGWTKAENIDEEFQEVLNKIKLSSISKNNSKDPGGRPLSKLEFLKLFRKQAVLWPFSIISLALLIANFNGNPILSTYAIPIFATMKCSINEYYATVFMGAAHIIGNIICLIFIHIVGKRIIVFISTLGSGICFIIVATYAYFVEIRYLAYTTNSNVTNSATVVDDLTEESSNCVGTIFLILAALLCTVGIRPLPWMLLGEMFPIEVKATASGISSGIGHLLGFVSHKIFFRLVTTMTLPGAFWFYGGVGVVGGGILFLILPETEGKTLFEIIDHFSGRSKLRNNVRKK